ncbi:MAG TPA: hypothetical protein VGE41_00395 [Verrucomicrobiae bacterium]
MSSYKGKPSGKYAEKKSSPGRKGDYKRSGWPEGAATQYTEAGIGQQAGARRRSAEEDTNPQRGRGRNRKAGAP